MKKLLTIALALVMVLALAAPAMATVGFGPAAEAEAATKTEFTVKIRALEFVPATTGFTFENNYFPDYDPTKGIVAGSDIRFVVDVTFPKYGDVASADEFEKYDDNMQLVVSGNNLAFGWINGSAVYPLNITNSATQGHETLHGSLPRVTTNKSTKSVYYMTIADYTTEPFYTLNGNVNTLYYSFQAQKNFDDAVPMGLSKSYTTTYSFMFVADVLNTANVTVTAAIDATGYAGQFVKNGTYRFTYKGETYSVSHTALSDGAYYDMWNEDEPTEVVRFTTDSKDQITNVAVTLGYGAEYGYNTVEPLTYKELQDAQLAVENLMGVGYAENLAAKNAALYIKAAQDLIEAQTSATLTDKEALWVNSVIKGAKYASGTNQASVTNALTATDTFAGTMDLFTAAGQALINEEFDVATTATDVTAAEAWKALAATDGYKNLVIGLAADQIASSITGVPFTVNYKNSVPFLGWLTADSMAHCEWYNVNKDVKLAEVVYNLNDKVHASGFVLTSTELSALTSQTNVAGIHAADATPAWADAGLKLYIQTQNLYDGKDVTASKDVNKVMYNALNPVFKEMLGVLGFEWDGTTAYMYRAAFVEKFGGKLYNEASYTYAAYTSALVVADPNAQPPQTGDTTSVLGFVMIAVAVLAAGAVVVKKVRA